MIATLMKPPQKKQASEEKSDKRPSNSAFFLYAISADELLN
jgi:hypothetical protein